MPRYWFPKPYADLVARWRAPFGFLLVAAFAWFSYPTPLSLAVGTPISVAGLLIRGWAAGHLRKNQQLATSGPYAYTRNPLYLGTSLVAAGLVIATRNPALAVLFAAAFVLFYLPGIELEEQHLRMLFPEYARYAERVPRLWPHWKPVGDRRRFEVALYLRNREYQGLAAYLAGTLYLLWKARSI